MPGGGEAPSALEYIPSRPSLPKLAAAVQGCRGCDLYRNATQAVFGAGPRAADVMLVGEQPGDREDVEGAPFVGPAGLLLDKSLEEAGIDRKRVYVTNAVKHFKWTPAPRGKKRLHKKPSIGEVRACRPWLDAEIAVVKPRVIVCLGATAAQALLGTRFRVTTGRGKLIPSELAEVIVATMHPSSVLRAPGSAARAQARAELVRDLSVVHMHLDG